MSHPRPLHRVPGRPGFDPSTAAGRADHAAPDIRHEDLGGELVDHDVGFVPAIETCRDDGAHAILAHVAEGHRDGLIARRHWASVAQGAEEQNAKKRALRGSKSQGQFALRHAGVNAG